MRERYYDVNLRRARLSFDLADLPKAIDDAFTAHGWLVVVNDPVVGTAGSHRAAGRARQARRLPRARRRDRRVLHRCRDRVPDVDRDRVGRGLVAACVVLPLPIVLGYGVRAADREDRERKLLSRARGFGFAAHAAQAEPRELGDPVARAASASTSRVGSCERARGSTDSPSRRARARARAAARADAGISMSVEIASAAASRISSTMRANSGRCGSTRRTAAGTPAGRRRRTGSTRGSRLDPLAAASSARPVASASVREQLAPVSSSSSTYSARLVGKCWYSTGLVTPAASAMSSIDVAWKPCSAKHVARDVEQLAAALVGGQSHRGATATHLDARLQRHHVAVDVVEVARPQRVDVARLRRRERQVGRRGVLAHLVDR